MPAEMAQVLVDKNGRPAEYANGKNGPVWGGYKSFKNAEKVYLQIPNYFPIPNWWSASKQASLCRRKKFIIKCGNWWEELP